ncbi:MAG TPA: ParB/RepB/Spo0J family partition protein [Planctomycetota bacterium]|nr:ParB/RepB/Spo0J family partition protein [Planctomycetota bacterium]
MPEKKKATATKKRAAPRKPRKPKPKAPSPLSVKEVSEPVVEGDLARHVAEDSGHVIASYREPYGGHKVLLVALPIEKVERTPYQRDVSPAHVKKLARSIEKVGRFLDPVLVVRQDGKYWVPNGGHRLEALREAGATTVTALLIPEVEVAHKILALNTEKAHNLKERALEVVRLERVLAAAGDTRKEKDLELELEEGAFVTIGAAYEKRPRLAGGAYAPMLKRVDPLLDLNVKDALARHEAQAAKLLLADDEVTRVVEALKAKGMKSPYLRTFVVARVNPVRWVGETSMGADECLDQVIDKAKKFAVDRVNEQDLAKVSGPPPEPEE